MTIAFWAGQLPNAHTQVIGGLCLVVMLIMYFSVIDLDDL